MKPKLNLFHFVNLTIASVDPKSLKYKELRSIADAFLNNANQLHAFSWSVSNQFVQTYIKDVNISTKDQSISVELAQKSYDDLSRRMEEYEQLCSEEVRNGLIVLMYGQLVLAWTAFETLVSDLWEAALNTHLDTLVSKAWQGRRIPFLLLREMNFNTTHKMGTILKRRLKQPTYEIIAKEYRRAFKNGNASSENFWKSNDIVVPYKLRNLIVHESGIINKRFRRFWESAGQQSDYLVLEEARFSGIAGREN